MSEQAIEKQHAILLETAQNLTRILEKIDKLLEVRQGATHYDLTLIAVQTVGIAMQVSDVLALQMEGDK